MHADPPTKWGLHDRTLRALLARLDADPTIAGEKYEQLRQGLIKLFDRRGAPAPDICADETIDRVAGKLARGDQIDDPFKFAYGVARLVWLEQARRPTAREIALNVDVTPMAGTIVTEEENEPEDSRLACFERCLAELGTDARDLILRYYGDEQGDRIRARAALAGGLGLTQSALRNRAQRIRDRLERCTMACAGRQAPTGSHDV